MAHQVPAGVKLEKRLLYDTKYKIDGRNTTG